MTDQAVQVIITVVIYRTGEGTEMGCLLASRSVIATLQRC